MALSTVQLLIVGATCLVILYNIVNNLFTRYQQGKKAKQWGCQAVPTEPTRWPFGIDILLKVIEADKEQRLPDYIVDRFNKIGRYTWKANILGASNIVTAEPRNIQAILATQFNDFKMSKIREKNFKLFLGRSIFTVDGQEWHVARDIIRPIFSRENVSNLQLLEKHVQAMFRCIAVGDDAWTGNVCLTELFPCLTIDSATELFLGKSPGALEDRLAGRHGGKDFHWAFETIERGLATRLRLQSLYWLKSTKELKECIRILNDFTAKAMQEADENQEHQQDKRYDYLSILRSRTNDPNEVREHVLGLLAAGRDTTAALLGWVFYCLIRNPQVFEKLRSIILETFGDESSGSNSITFEKLKACRYLQHVMNETLRLHSIVTMNSRAAARDCTLPTGGGPDGTSPVFVAKDTEVRFSTHVMHRRHDLWGPDADEFVPERWETARPQWSYAPFNGGPRLCIGQQFALTEAGYVIVRMLQRFVAIEGLEIDLERDYHHYGMTCGPGGRDHEGVVVRMRVARG
ncbi:hypothetical protein PRZ48_014159 [Zasmidium cellare]|uniref:Cytochrome P450 n=1 Tax=Zasmidium cellare TaxID=395010 RepID=A0ABR0E0X2_ZASCE|nr:hypothetical protein PRZ48_014159 [Zasmidium cellare]